MTIVLDSLERGEKLERHRQSLKRFQKEIQETFDKNLDEKLIKFIEENSLEINDEITYYLRKYNEFLKVR